MYKTFILITALFAFIAFTPAESEDLNSCVEKYNSTWGEPCEKCTYNNDIYQAFYRNKCNKNVDVLISLQDTDKNWQCFYFDNVAPNDTMHAYVCKGTGKALKWVKKAGDKEVSFPTCTEVNELY